MDISTAHTEACPCGNGSIEVLDFEPSHGWSFHSTYSASIKCPDCDRKYSIRRLDGWFDLVLTNEMEAASQHHSEVVRKQKAAFESTEAQQLLQELIRQMDALKFKNAKYRLIKPLTYVAESTFVKQFNGSAAWVHGNMRYPALGKVMKLVRLRAPTLVQAIKEADAFEKSRPDPKAVKRIFRIPGGD